MPPRWVVTERPTPPISARAAWRRRLAGMGGRRRSRLRPLLGLMAAQNLTPPPDRTAGEGHSQYHHHPVRGLGHRGRRRGDWRTGTARCSRATGCYRADDDRRARKPRKTGKSWKPDYRKAWSSTAIARGADYRGQIEVVILDDLISRRDQRLRRRRDIRQAEQRIDSVGPLAAQGTGIGNPTKGEASFRRPEAGCPARRMTRLVRDSLPMRDRALVCDNLLMDDNLLADDDFMGARDALARALEPRVCFVFDRRRMRGATRDRSWLQRDRHDHRHVAISEQILSGPGAGWS